MKCKDCYKDCPYRCYTTDAECCFQQWTAKQFDWQSFRAEAAKDILCAIISRNPATYLANIDFVVDQSVIAAGRLIESLNEKEKEEK